MVVRHGILQSPNLIVFTNKWNIYSAGAKTELTRARAEAFSGFVARTMKEEDKEMRVVCLGMILDFILFYEDEFVSLCDPSIKLVEAIDELLDDHANRCYKEKGNHVSYNPSLILVIKLSNYKVLLTFQWDELEFQFLMEISQWVEGAMCTVSWFRPAYCQGSSQSIKLTSTTSTQTQQ